MPKSAISHFLHLLTSNYARWKCEMCDIALTALKSCPWYRLQWGGSICSGQGVGGSLCFMFCVHCSSHIVSSHWWDNCKTVNYNTSSVLCIVYYDYVLCIIILQLYYVLCILTIRCSASTQWNEVITMPWDYGLTDPLKVHYYYIDTACYYM